MSGEFLEAQAGSRDAADAHERLGLMAGKVIRNCDHTRAGRVQVRLTALRGIEIWARVIVPDTGVYFIPQVNDEVLVGFHNGDANEAYVLGRMWNDVSPPPRQEDRDPVTQRVIRTPWGHEIAFDQTEKSLVIKTGSGPHVTLKADSVEIGADDKNSATLTLDASGRLTVNPA